MWSHNFVTTITTMWTEILSYFPMVHLLGPKYSIACFKIIYFYIFMFQSHVAILFPCVLFCMYSMFLNIMFQLHVSILFLCVLFGVYCVFTWFQCFYVSRFHPFHKSIHSIILAHVSRICPFFCLFTCVTISLVMVPQCFMFYICPCVTNLFFFL